MFRRILNVGKGYSSAEKLQQQQQQQQKNLFQLNEIRSYGFSHLCCLGYSPSLSLLAVGSKYGLVRVLGNSSVEFSYQLESGNSIRQIEFIDCRPQQDNETTSGKGKNKKQQQASASNDKLEVADKSTAASPSFSTSAKVVVLTDNGQLHLFELKTFKHQNYSDNTTQTDTGSADCCQLTPNETQQQQQAQLAATEYTKLEYAGLLDYFKCKPEDEDRSRRVTTIEVSANGQIVFVGTEGGNLYQVPLSKFELTTTDSQQQVQSAQDVTVKPAEEAAASVDTSKQQEDAEEEAVNLSDEPQIREEAELEEPFEMIKFEADVASQLGDDVKAKKQGAIESIKRHPTSNVAGASGASRQSLILISYHRGLSVIYDPANKSVEKYFYHNQVLESSCFADQAGDFFYTSHNDGSYIKWDTRSGSQAKANEDFLGQLYGPYPCKPTPKIQACTGLLNDQLEDLVVFSGGMPRATYDDKNPVTIVRAEPDGKDSIKTVLDFTSKVLDFVVITRPRGNLGAGAKSTGGGGGGGKKNKNKQQQQQQQQQQLRNTNIAVALAILAEEEFVVIDLLNSESYLEFALPYLNCVHSSAITCNQHYSDVSDELYDKLILYNKQQLKGKLSPNEWPITGGKVIDAPEMKSHDILLTGHEDGSVNYWDVSDLSMRHLLHLSTAKFFATNDDDDLVPLPADAEAETNGNDSNNKDKDKQQSNDESQQQESAWPPLKRVGRFDPYSDDTRLAIRKLALCPQTGNLVVAGTGGQVLAFELNHESSELDSLEADEISIVNDQRFTWKGRDKLPLKSGAFKFEAGYKLASYVQLQPPVAASSLDLRADWHLYALGTSYGFILYDYAAKHCVVNKCTLNVQDFAIVSGDAAGLGAMSRKKSFRKSLRESFRRLRIGRSQRNQSQQPATTGVTPLPAEGAKAGTAFGRQTTGVRALNAPSLSQAESHVGAGAGVARQVYSTERQVEQKVELSSIVKCITLTSAVITNNSSFKPTLWVGTNSGQVLVYAITLAAEQQQQSAGAEASEAGEQQQQPPLTSAKLAKEIQLKHRAPIIAIFTSPEAPAPSVEQAAIGLGEKQASELLSAADIGKSTPSNESTPERKSNEPDEQQSSSGERAPSPSDKSPSKSAAKEPAMQPRVLICSEEQFKVFNLPNLKPFCKFKLTAHEGLRAKKISITQFLKPASSNKAQQQLSASKSLQSFATQTSPPASPVPPAEEGSDEAAAAATSANGSNNSNSKHAESNNNSPSTLNNNHTTSGKLNQTADASKVELMNAKFGAKSNSALAAQQADGKDTSGSGGAEASLFEPYMVCMSNQGDCAIYSVPDLKRQAQIQVCKREDVNGITSTMLTNYGEGYYLKSSSNFLRFSISSQRVLRVLSVV